MGKKKHSLDGQLADMDLKLLRIFKAIADNGGISAAEDELNIATSTISNYLADLEKRLSMRLCQRGRKGFALTEQGITVYSAIIELLNAVEVFQGRVKGSKERLLGNLQLAIAEGVSGYNDKLILQVLQRFTQYAPEVHVELQILTAEDVPRAVLDERLAIGISYIDKPVNGLDAIPLFGEHVLLYCGVDHPLFNIDDKQLSNSEIEKHKLVGTPRLRRGQELQAQIESQFFQGYAPQMEGRAILIQTGNFLAYLPKEYVAQMGLTEKMRPLKPEQFNYENDCFVLTRKGSHLSPVVESFLDCIKNIKRT